MARNLTKKNKYTEALENAMKQWYLHSATFRTTDKEYDDLLEKLKKLQKKHPNIAIHPMKPNERKQYPKCEFLRIKTEEEAFEYLQDLTPKEINQLATDVGELVENRIYVTMKDRVIDFKTQIRLINEPKRCLYSEPVKEKTSCHRVARTNRDDYKSRDK